MPLCSNSPYGMTKGLGEHICEWFCAHHDMSIIALRLWFPTTRERWDEWREKHGKVTHLRMAGGKKLPELDALRLAHIRE